VWMGFMKVWRIFPNKEIIRKIGDQITKEDKMANEKYKVKGKGNNKITDPDVEIDVDDKYEAYSKPIPDEPTPIPDGSVTWFNNFGIREKSTRKNEDVSYTVTLQALPADQLLYVLMPDNPVPQQVQTTPIGNSGKVRFTLNVGDPPVGSGP
jgi:hypothetical protein